MSRQNLGWSCCCFLPPWLELSVVAPALNECSDDGSWLDDDEGIADPDESSDSDDPAANG